MAKDRRWWIAATLVLVVAAIAVRVISNFDYPYPPGIDAGYYPLQTRTLLLRGRLLYDDMPALFWLNAAVSRILTITGIDLDAAVLIASRVLDSILEPFAAVGLMALGYAWSAGSRRALAGCLGAAVIVVLSPPVLRMLGDFQKNSAGVAVLCATLWVCRHAMVSGRRGAWLGLGAMAALAALTHFGAFVVTLGIVTLALLLWAVLEIETVRQRAIATVAIAAAVIALTGVVRVVDEHRATKLLAAPALMFNSGNFAGVDAPFLLPVLLLVAVATWIAWRDRATLARADAAIVAALGAVTIFLVVPKSFVYFDRLLLMALAPAALLLAFIMARLQRTAVILGTLCFVLSIALAAGAPRAVQMPVVTARTAAELRDLRARIDDPERTVVIAPHGLEWWAGYFLHTAARSAIPPGGLNGYRHVLYLQNTVGCPSDEWATHGMPPIPATATRIYAGRCFEMYQSR